MKLARLNEKPEIFCSIQGEGKNTGRRCVFIRTSQCNLFCKWCDTDYTWNFKGTLFEHQNNTKYDREQAQYQIDDMDVAAMALKYHVEHYVLTGGEPLIQQKELAEVASIIRQVQSQAYFEVETNGTLMPLVEFDNFVNQYNVSIKLSNSGVPEKLRLKPKVIQYFANCPKSYFKFVISDNSDVQEVLSLSSTYKINPQKIYLMPEGTTQKAIEESSVRVLEQSNANGFNYSDRLHVRLFGDERGR